jgi:hypothetical protein
VDAPFQQLGLYFIREFKEKLSNGFKWILMAIDYFTRWVIKAIPTKRETNNVVKQFLEERIITRFGVLAKIKMENAKDFS